jgi:hypothetical protein
MKKIVPEFISNNSEYQKLDKWFLQLAFSFVWRT